MYASINKWPNSSKISDDERDMLEGLESLKDNKSPTEDGLTVEFS